MRKDLHDDWVSVRDEIEEAFDTMYGKNEPERAYSTLKEFVIDTHLSPLSNSGPIILEKEFVVRVKILSWR